VASVFDVSPRQGQSVADAVVEFLRTKRMLVVIDNCEHLLDAVADFVERVERSCREVVILATSQDR